MKPDYWSKIELICQEALNIPEGERDAFIDSACKGDESLLYDVKSLLKFSDSNLLDEPVVSLSADVFTRENHQQTDLRIGSYRLIRNIATGGMGEVYLAARDDASFDQYVAIKVIRKELISGEVLTRFYEERQILASLNHLYIGRLFDGGTTADGLPWFAMEYVEGIPVTDYCRKYDLSTDQCIHLFLKICSAVQYAHQNMVIHHDLKPGNILVTPEGEPKLLDFGISNMLARERVSGEGGAEQRGARGRLMTPEYASPEQIVHGSVTTASDVYSLGVLLYELLTETRPFTFEDESPEEIKRRILSDPVATPTHTAGRRSISFDLEQIVLKALRKNPEERYATVEQLTADLQNYKAMLPVSAVPDSISYRSGKFIQRNRWGVAAATLITVIVFGFGIVSYIQSQEIEARAIEAEQQRDRVERISDFLVGLFESADPSEAQDNDITALELLNRGALRIENEMEGQPLLQADLYLVIADVFESMGLYDRAEELARRSLDLSSGLHGSSHPDVASALNSLGWIQFRKGEYPAADSLLGETLSMRRDLFGEQHVDVARALNDLAVIRQARGDLAGTDSLLSRALEIRKRLYGDSHESVAVTMSNYAALKWAMGDLGATEELMRDVLDLLQANAENGEDMRVAVGMTNLAAVLLTQGSYDEAEDLYRQALDIRYRLVGEEHPDVAYSLAHLGNLLRIRGDYEEAEILLERALELRQRLLGPRHLLVADSRRTLALLYGAMEAYDRAENSYLDAIAIYREVFPDGHTQTAEVLHLLGKLYFDTGRAAEAEPLLREAYDIRRRDFSENDLRSVDTSLRLGMVQAELGFRSEAIERLESGLEKLEQLENAPENLKEQAETVLDRLQ